LRNDRQSYQDDFFRMDLPTLPSSGPGSAPECGCPRDYRLGGSIFVRQFSKRLEVISPEGCRQNHAREHH
jgi:ATP-dependent DNA helicase RecG